MQFTGIIRNWVEDPYYKCIWGQVFGDILGRFPDGKQIHTSRVIELNREAGYVTTHSGNIYKLEEEKVDA
ncbi:hypothetical protein [Mesorhizobium sp. STM 4661]|uniref:hypothetical protein n=1 Tax=Mesorhizobium sp. STM 4661 TaxID=1297570 RepID=UPI0002BEC1E5|nr:hypothetical protein [Mesorhizobium sp. STM 4661]CCV12965.1 hypothetical protein MESS4_510132 [Mesorhizobium sp. STM 4661]